MPHQSRVGSIRFDECVSRCRFFVLLLALTLAGCGGAGEPRRVAMNGSVIANEQLIPAGTVRFLPEAGNSAPIAVTAIKDGLYHFSKADGPFPGKYKVVVNVELEYSELAALSQSEAIPSLMWEDEALVPEADSGTKHFIWEKAEKKADAKTSAPAGTSEEIQR